jgi:hypothetical protein
MTDTPNMFTAAQRTDGSTYYTLTAAAPETLRDAVRECHGDHMPNDTVWELCADVWQWIDEHAHYADVPDSDNAAHMAADYLADGQWCAYFDRRRWFSGDPLAPDACEQWREEYGGVGSVDDMIGGGLYVRLRSIAEILGAAYADVIADTVTA